ncbi:hypothetical protein J4H86_06510 [Spiractinospora alimapuensis]|uniref:hypothetical protein n=1 Tax=Spiractinospora alimapuensis TaxID=2820884 RepID=UPI001F22A9FE|nr:hypothetical protein [Spiractinospora alimapuensis]QVQ53406.1 hypothetical protein J4H86_06510 [Spiractinospora alimapuensis]
MPEPTPLRVVIVNGNPSEQCITMGLATIALGALEFGLLSENIPGEVFSQMVEIAPGVLNQYENELRGA